MTMSSQTTPRVAGMPSKLTDLWDETAVEEATRQMLGICAGRNYKSETWILINMLDDELNGSMGATDLSRVDESHEME